MNDKDSDVYVITGKRGWECCGCSLSEAKWGTLVPTRARMIVHLSEHLGAGHKVPTRAIVQLAKEIEEEENTA